MTPHRTPGAAATALAVFLLLVAGCTSGNQEETRPKASASPTPSRASVAGPSVTGGPAALRQYYRQPLDWQPCRRRLQCARVRVPLDYAKPGGRTTQVAVLKSPATEPKRRLGSVVYNPGGPGVSGADYAENADLLFDKDVLARYDVVGLDPRGIGASTPVDCLGDQRLDAFLTTDPDPGTPAEIRAADAATRELGRGCLRRSGPLAAHVSTEEVARDLDILRANLGEKLLTYFGASYGTSIGSTYADLYPRRVGRMVLDGAQDPRSTTLEVNLRQAKGFETALRAYVADCQQQSSCPLGSSVDEGVRKVQQLLAGVDRQPLRAGDRELTIGNAFYGVIFPLYSKRFWPVLTNALTKAFAGDGEILMLLADEYLHRNADGTFKDTSFETFYAVTCVDHDDAVPEPERRKHRKQFDRASPTFGRALLFSTGACEQWPVHTGRGPTTVRARGADPIVVIGTTRDPATPLVWAKALARQLDSGVLITRDGDGHTGYRQGSRCVDDAVDTYLLTGNAPGDDLTCR